ncbi:MAG: prepilin-type N-terminal cleavage/methylation domain-containing protein [Verrucomicrobiota bacterium]|nr:prepilin-type N-terminal cleavage/methylation domain-containing protein [Verrucomicrobiota bacterium]
MKSLAQYSKKQKEGFTLIEVLVSLALISFISIMLFYIVSGLTDSWRTEMARMDAYSSGRVVLDFIGEDLKKGTVDEYSEAVNPAGDYTNSIQWGDVPPGTEFNWRAMYCSFPTVVAMQVPTNGPTTAISLFNFVTPATRGTNLVRAISYGLSNGFLMRWQTTDEAIVFSANGVNTKGWTVTNKPDILAQNVYWVQIDSYGTTDNVNYPATSAWGSPSPSTNIFSSSPSGYTFGCSQIVAVSTNAMPSAIRLTMRVASTEIMQKIKRNSGSPGQLLFTNMPFYDQGGDYVASTNKITKPNIREVSLLIKLNN